jgi:hairy-and-enhancer-of-split protein
METSMDLSSVSRSHQYRKVMKPILERKRRARINKCLDDLKDLMMVAIEAEGESIARLEKADVLELTVRHLQKLKRQKMLQSNPSIDADRFCSGYSSCASEVSKFLASVPGVEIGMGTQLMSHLGSQMKSKIRNNSVPLSINCHQQVSSSSSSFSPSSDCGYSSGRDSTPSPSLSVGSISPAASSSPVWRPF